MTRTDEKQMRAIDKASAATTGNDDKEAEARQPPGFDQVSGTLPPPAFAVPWLPGNAHGLSPDGRSGSSTEQYTQLNCNPHA